MNKLSDINAISVKPWIIVGTLLLSVIIGTSGCSSNTATSLGNPIQDQTVQEQTYQKQTNQGQMSRNPAMQAVTEIRRLQSNQENALSSVQKDKIKSILQELISLCTNPSQDVLQQKADAINALLTDQQKSYLAKQRNSQGNNPNGNNPNGNNPNGNRQNGASGNNQPGSSFNPQDMYQQVFDSLK